MPHRLTFGSLFILATLWLISCRNAAPAAPTPADVGSEMLPGAQAAVDAALAEVRSQYGEQAPPAGLTWQTTRTTPEGIVGAEKFNYVSGDWTLGLSYPVVAPDVMIYTIIMNNSSTGFYWEGSVNAAGEVTESVGP